MDLVKLAPNTTEAENEVTVANVAPSGQSPINISGDVVAQAVAAYPAEQRSLIQWLFGYTKHNLWNWVDLEHHTKISKTTLWRIFHGKYRNGDGEQVALDSVCEKITRFKALAGSARYARQAPVHQNERVSVD